MENLGVCNQKSADSMLILWDNLHKSLLSLMFSCVCVTASPWQMRHMDVSPGCTINIISVYLILKMNLNFNSQWKTAYCRQDINDGGHWAFWWFGLVVVAFEVVAKLVLIVAFNIWPLKIITLKCIEQRPLVLQLQSVHLQQNIPQHSLCTVYSNHIWNTTDCWDAWSFWDSLEKNYI